MSRPKRTNKDANHWIPRDFLRDRCGGFEVVQFGKGTPRAYTANYRGVQVVLWDTADFGGVWSDWFMYCPLTGRSRWIEIKTDEAYGKKDHDMTDGEKWLESLEPLPFRIIVTEDAFSELIDWIILD